MSDKRCSVLSILLTASLLLTACLPTASIQPTTAPTTPTITVTPPDGSSIKVGFVTYPDDGGTNRAFNQLAWVGIQNASKEMGMQTTSLESKQPTDDAANIDTLASEGYNVIVTVGSAMGDVTALKAKQYPNIKFAIVDHAYTEQDSLPNLTSLMFAEEQAGFLAGVLAGGMSKSGFVCSVSSLRTPASDASIISFHTGATWQAGTDLKIMNNYINIQTTDANVPSFDDSTQGKETALRLIANGCDVLFAVGGDSVKGVILAAKENNIPAVGADVDQYNANPEAQSTLISSAMKNADVAVYNYLKTVANGSVKAGISLGTLQNGGVGLAPFHDWESQIPADLKTQIQKASDGIKDGSIKIDLPSGR